MNIRLVLLFASICLPQKFPHIFLRGFIQRKKTRLERWIRKKQKNDQDQKNSQDKPRTFAAIGYSVCSADNSNSHQTQDILPVPRQPTTLPEEPFFEFGLTVDYKLDKTTR